MTCALHFIERGRVGIPGERASCLSISDLYLYDSESLLTLSGGGVRNAKSSF